VGKSTLLRSLPGFRYQTLDDQGLAALASQSPEELLRPPCVVDEAQKSPGVFDAVKADVDREKRPGKFVLTGSVRFSRRTMIRESLTGRAKTIQMFPFTCAESLGIPYQDRWVRPNIAPRVSRKQFQRFLEKGGMPAIFAARSATETTAYWRSLTESYVHRDLLLAVPKNPRPRLAEDILRAIASVLALGELPTFARILRKTGGTRAMVERHLVGLEDLMIVHRLGHWRSSRAKDIFMPFDPAFFLTLLGETDPNSDAAIRGATLHITLINEALSQAQAADRPIDLRYAVSPRGEVVHLITSASGSGVGSAPCFWKIAGEPVPHAYQLRFLEALRAKEKGKAFVLSSTAEVYKQGKVQVLPWESVL
jgi:predicted AAA+ superfamily ATPase